MTPPTTVLLRHFRAWRRHPRTTPTTRIVMSRRDFAQLLATDGPDPAPRLRAIVKARG